MSIFLSLLPPPQLRYDKKVRRTERHMKQLTMLGLGEGALLTLDEWEMPRENVVLNRKLGEGAFGTVYGGEALLGNCKWAAVAVKTLKLGASVEEKVTYPAHIYFILVWNTFLIGSHLHVSSGPEIIVVIPSPTFLKKLL